MKPLRRWPYAVFLALDLLLSAIAFGAPGETISARLARNHGVASAPCRALDWIVLTVFRKPHHCEDALAAFNEREKAATFYSG
jgi:hypothetical protein